MNGIQTWEDLRAYALARARSARKARLRAFWERLAEMIEKTP